MKGVIFESAGAQPKVVDNLEKPKPLPDQILVRSVYMAINPVYACLILPVSLRYD
jgi:NADPH:quinone reductase-like Zn-dependent oxidoreductase